MEMKKYKLYEIADYVSSKVSTSQLPLQDYITTDCLLQNKCGRECAENLPPKSATVTAFKPGDILIANIRPYLKKIWYANSEGGNSADVLTIRAKDGFEKLYVYYALFQDSFFDYAAKGAKGSKMPRGDKNQIMNFEILVPENLQVQKKIASTLSTIDKRIENLRTQNRVLERTAKTIYDYTFLQCAGRKTVYNKILKRNIPEGWEVKKIGELAEIVNGATPSTAVDGNFDGDIVWITPKDLSDQKSKFVYFGERTITLQGYDSCSTTLVPVDSILMSSRAPIGLVSIAKCELCTNQGFKTFVPKSDGYTEYLYYYLLTNMKKIEQLGAGTTFKEVSRGSLTSFPVIAPDEKSLATFNASIKPIFRKQLVNTKQIETLTTQRNTLLPLLMNGQVAVE